MAEFFNRIGTDIILDVKARLPWIKDDWRQGWNCGVRILSPAAYIFLASALPAFAFGQQLAEETAGTLTVVHVLVSTSLAGVLQAVIGGQPLLIVGVSEPIVLIYSFMFRYASSSHNSLPKELYLPWAAWVCTWTSLLLVLLAVSGCCGVVKYLSRMSGEVFSSLIALLFIQAAVKGTIDQFQAAPHSPSPPDPTAARYLTALNGFTALLLSAAYFASAVASLQAHSWLYARGWIRRFIANYGVALMVIVWTAVSYAIRGFPDVPRRVSTANTWEVTSGWFPVTRMKDVPGSYIAAALLPACIIAVLFLFDHTVSAQLAQQKEFRLCKPSSYHYDMLLLGVMTLGLGLLGVPPVNGVLPQAPMHTKSLARLGLEMSTRRKGRTGAASSGSPSRTPARAATASSPRAHNGALGSDPEDGKPAHGPVTAVHAEGLECQVVEQRVTGLLQSLFMVVCLGATPAIKLIPVSVVWGHFAFMGYTALPGNQLWGRTLLLFMDPKIRKRMLLTEHLALLDVVPFKVVAAFTLLQLLYMLGIWALITYAEIVGVAFPIPIMLLVPIRIYLLPRLIPEVYLQHLDATEYEQGVPLSPEEARQEVEDMDVEALEDSLDREFAGLQIKHHITHQQLQRRVEAARSSSHTSQERSTGSDRRHSMALSTPFQPRTSKDLLQPDRSRESAPSGSESDDQGPASRSWCPEQTLPAWKTGNGTNSPGAALASHNSCEEISPDKEA